jgi:hypothetical protein
LRGHLYELVENLEADDPTAAQAFARGDAAIVIRQGIDKNFGVEKNLHLSLASFRSNL